MISSVEKYYKDGEWTGFYIVSYTGTTDKSSVPHNEENRHYQEILEWVAAGNTITDSGGE